MEKEAGKSYKQNGRAAWGFGKILNRFGSSQNAQYLTFDFYNSMDEHNKKAADVWASSGVDAAIKHMVTRPDGTSRSYSEMRAFLLFFLVYYNEALRCDERVYFERYKNWACSNI